MLKRLAALFGKPEAAVSACEPSATEQWTPFARALLDRSTLEQQLAESEQVAKGLPPLSEFPESSPKEKLEGATFFVARHLATEAAKRIGRKPFFLNLDPLDGKDLALVSFAILIAEGIVQRLRLDGVSIDFSAVVGSVLRISFLAYSHEDTVKYGEKCLEVYRSTSNATAANVEKWRNDLYEIACLYVVQNTSSGEEVRQTDLIRLFGGQLQRFLDAVAES